MKCVCQTKIFGLLIAFISAAALTSALIAQYGFDLKPCVLCLYQRVPYIVNIVLGLVIFRHAHRGHPKAATFMITLAGLVFLINSAIAFYHVGVEQHWWVSVLEGCKFDPTRLREAMYEPAARCDEIAWQDPLLGITMAGYNFVFCLGLGIICLITAKHSKMHWR